MNFFDLSFGIIGDHDRKTFEESQNQKKETAKEKTEIDSKNDKGRRDMINLYRLEPQAFILE